ncbi:MAG: DUF1330 domain-containing protein [Candidatus Omnitrophota bacterium]
MIIEIKIKDSVPYAKYVENVRSIVEKYKGKYLSRGSKITPIFGDWDPERMVLIEFPSSDDVHRWLQSDEYKRVAGLRERSTITRAILVEGC